MAGLKISRRRSLYVCDSTPRLHHPTKLVRLKREEEELRLNPGTVRGHMTHAQPNRLSDCLSVCPQSPACRPYSTSLSSCRPCHLSPAETCRSAGSSIASCCQVSLERRPTASGPGVSSRSEPRFYSICLSHLFCLTSIYLSPPLSLSFSLFVFLSCVSVCLSAGGRLCGVTSWL